MHTNDPHSFMVGELKN